MKLPINSSTKPALVFTLVLLIVIAFIWVQEDTTNVARGEFWEQSADDYTDYEAEALEESIDRTVTSVERYSPVAVGGGGPVVRSKAAPTEDPILVANRLMVELRQVVRAGRSMKSLRGNVNSVLNRRCQEGRNELEQWINSVAERERRLVLPASVVSLNDAYTYAKICSSCRTDATGYCDLAEQALTIVSASLGNKR